MMAAAKKRGRTTIQKVPHNPVVVMAEGRVLAEGSMADIRRDERVLEAYFGGRGRQGNGEG